MSANPPIPWYSSSAVRALIGTILLSALAWLTGVLVATGPIVWTWRALAIAEIGPISAFILQFFRADIQGPAALNFLPGMAARAPKP